MRHSETVKPRKGAVLLGFYRFLGVSRNTLKLDMSFTR